MLGPAMRRCHASDSCAPGMGGICGKGGQSGHHQHKAGTVSAWVRLRSRPPARGLVMRDGRTTRLPRFHLLPALMPTERARQIC